MTTTNEEISTTVLRERGRLRDFIRRRVRDPAAVEDILQDVLEEFVAAYRLPEPIERAGAWLIRVARNRIIDFVRRRDREQPGFTPGSAAVGGDDDEHHLELLLPSPADGPEAGYLRSSLLTALQAALDDLPPEQREVFMAHELGGTSFRQMAARSGVSINTLLARKRYAVLHLRARLQPLYDEFKL